MCVCPKCLLSIKCPQVLLLRTPNIFQCEWLLIANCNASVSTTLRPRGELLPRIVINLVIQKCTHTHRHTNTAHSYSHIHASEHLEVALIRRASQSHAVQIQPGRLLCSCLYRCHCRHCVPLSPTPQFPSHHAFYRSTLHVSFRLAPLFLGYGAQWCHLN